MLAHEMFKHRRHLIFTCFWVLFPNVVGSHQYDLLLLLTLASKLSRLLHQMKSQRSHDQLLHVISFHCCLLTHCLDVFQFHAWNASLCHNWLHLLIDCAHCKSMLIGEAIFIHAIGNQLALILKNHYSMRRLSRTVLFENWREKCLF